ncbi:hypothetical protein ACFL40_05945 [candidate division KSB1 bacterium]
MTIGQLQEIVKESKQRFAEFIDDGLKDDEFYKNSYLVIQFINPSIQIPVSAASAGFEFWYKMKELIVVDNNWSDFIKLCDDYFSEKGNKEILRNKILDLFSTIEITDFNIEVRYPTLDIEKIKDLEIYLEKRRIKQNLSKSSIRTVLYRVEE